ncbi:MAG: DUF3857 domain-containing protein [Pyrinomonadaceae bacterium]
MNLPYLHPRLRALAAASAIILAIGAGIAPGQRRPTAPPPKKIVSITGTAPAAKAEPLTAGVTFDNYVVAIDVNADGTSTRTIEFTQRFESAMAVEAFARFEQEFNSSLDELTLSEVYIVKPDGSRRAVAPESARVHRTAQAEAAPGFSSLMVAEVTPSGVEIGDALHIKVRRVSKKTYFDGKFDDLMYFPAAFGWKNVVIDLTAPTDLPLQFEAIGLEGGKLPDTAGAGRSRWRWTLKDLKALPIEEIFLDHLTPSPRLALTTFKSFDELGAAFWNELERKAAVTPEVQALADEITKNAKTPEQQAYDIYLWVNKNIRYLSIVLDRGGWVPRSTTEILADRYGDCKDYSTLLYALLRAKYIESGPVLIRSDLSRWFPSVPVSSYFNHAVLYIPSLDLYADATAANTRLGLIPQSIAGKKALVTGKKVWIAQTPGDRPDESQLVSTTDVTLTADGAVKAAVRNRYVGKTEILFRPMFSDSSIKRSSDVFVATMLSYFGQNGTGRIVSVADPFKVGEPFMVDLEVELRDVTTIGRAGSFTLPAALNLNNPLALEILTKADSRRTDIPIGAMRFREDFTITLPDGVEPREPSAPVFEVKNSVGLYRREIRLEGGKAKASRELVVNRDVVTAAEYPLLKDLIARLVENYNITVDYIAPAATARVVSSLRTSSNAPAPKTDEKSLQARMMERFAEKTLSPAQVTRLESSLAASPNDLEARRDLIRHYSSYKYRDTPKRAAARLRHYVWFVENRPEMSAFDIFGVNSNFRPTAAEFKTLLPIWTAAVENNVADPHVRLNAFEFVKDHDPAAAEKILTDGIALDPSQYLFPLELSKMFETRKDASEPDAARRERLAKNLRYGQKALELLKTERSDERDELRARLLETISRSALELGENDLAVKLATELVLDHGQDARSANYDSAAHIGNIVLGRAALRQNDRKKAAEHLLIAIRAPLRKATSWLPEIDTALARELLAAGEKDAVLEYLKLCGELWNLRNEKELYADQVKALRKWQDQIRRGEVPSFDFYKP